MDMALGPSELAGMRERAQQARREAKDAEADAVSTMLRSPGGGTHRYFYDDRMERVKVLQGRAQRLEDEVRRHEDEARRIRNTRNRK